MFSKGTEECVHGPLLCNLVQPIAVQSMHAHFLSKCLVTLNAGSQFSVTTTSTQINY